jgi:hypothetical protein
MFKPSFINLTPRSIFVTIHPDFLDDRGIEYPASGQVARMAANRAEGPLCGPHRMVQQSFGSVEGLPDPVAGVVYIVTITGGTGAGQSRMILAYVGSTKVASVSRAWATTPDATSTFAILPGAAPEILDSGIAQAGAASTITLASYSSATDDLYVGTTVSIMAGTGAGQERVITAYVGSTKVATVASTWTTQPDFSSVYELLPVGRSVVVSNLDKTGYSLSGGVTIANGAITSSSFAADAIDANALATSAAAEIASNVLGTSVPGAFGAGTLGNLVGNNLNATVSSRAVPGDAMTLTAGERTAVQAKILSDATPFAGALIANLDVAVSTRLASASYTSPPSAATIASQVWGTTLPGAFGAGTAGFYLNARVSTVPGLVWDELVASHATAATFGLLIGTDLDATISSRLATSSYTAPPSAASNASAVWSTAVPGAFSAGSAGFVVGTNLDTTVSSRLATSGYTAPPSAATVATTVWDELVTGHNTVSSYGLLVKTDLDAAVSSRAAPGAAMALTAGERTTVQALIIDDATPFHGARIDAAVSSRAAPGAAMALTPGERTTVQALVLSDATPFPGARVDAAVSTRATQAQILSDATPFAGARIDAAITSRSAPGDAMALVSNAITAAKINASAITAAAFAAGAVDASAFAQSAADKAWATAARTLTGIGSSGIASQSSVDTANTALTAIAGAGFTAGVDDLHSLHVLVAAIPTSAAPSASAVASAVWATVVPGAFGGTTAGGILGTNLNATVSSRSTLTQGQILSDSTPFAGAAVALLDAAVSSRATAAAVVAQAISGAPAGSVGAALLTASSYTVPSAAAVASAVWATAEGGSAGTLGAAITLLRKRTTNKRILAANGTLSLYDDDSTTVLRTVQITDVTGLPISLSAGEPARATAEV